jgi:hypothetical protein
MGVDTSHHGGPAFPGLESLYSNYEGSIKGGDHYTNGHGEMMLKDKVRLMHDINDLTAACQQSTQLLFSMCPGLFPTKFTTAKCSLFHAMRYFLTCP